MLVWIETGIRICDINHWKMQLGKGRYRCTRPPAIQRRLVETEDVKCNFVHSTGYADGPSNGALKIGEYEYDRSMRPWTLDLGSWTSEISSLDMESRT